MAGVSRRSWARPIWMRSPRRSGPISNSPGRRSVGSVVNEKNSADNAGHPREGTRQSQRRALDAARRALRQMIRNIAIDERD